MYVMNKKNPYETKKKWNVIKSNKDMTYIKNDKGQGLMYQKTKFGDGKTAHVINIYDKKGAFYGRNIYANKKSALKTFEDYKKKFPIKK